MYPFVIRVGGAAMIAYTCSTFTEVMICMVGVIVYGTGVMYDYVGKEKE